MVSQVQLLVLLGSVVPSAQVNLPISSIQGTSSDSGDTFYTSNPVCVKSKCINPLTPGLNDLPRLEGLVWQCSAPGEVKKYLQFCKAAIDYDPAIPSPQNDSVALDSLVEAQDGAASTMFFYHLAGLGYEAWDYKAEKDISAEPCVKRVYDLVCYTYFPKNQGGCQAGSQVPYLKPCKNACQSYLDTCQVECCDDSATCVFEITSDLGGGAVSKITGYADQDGPSAICTGQSGSGRASAPMTLLMFLLGCHLLAGSAEQPRAESVSRRGLGGAARAVLLLASGVCAVSLQGCALSIPSHSVGNWQKKSDYLVKFEYVPPGQLPTAATLNSCGAGASGREVCSGRGQCKPWSHQPLKLTDPSANEDPPGVSFCVCDADWADPECRTRRKSQMKAFLLSLLGGFLGLDRFYLGLYMTGLLKLLTLGGFGTWWLFDIVRMGSGPVYAKDYRVSSDLPHWVYMLVIVMLFSAAGLVYSLNSYVIFRRLKRAQVAKLHGEDDMFPQPGARFRSFGLRSYTGYGSVL